MLKHLLVGAVGLSSLALADNRYHPAAPAMPPAPAPVVAVAAFPLPPPPVVTAPAPMVMPAVRNDERGERRDDRLDVLAARSLLREFDLAVSFNDYRALRRLDRQLSAFLNDEVTEAYRECGGRVDRDDRHLVERVNRLQGQLWRLSGRLDRFALDQKRSIFVQAIDLAERDLRNDRHDRFDRRDDGPGRREEDDDRFGRRDGDRRGGHFGRR